jgi:hypothetical protein
LHDYYRVCVASTLSFVHCAWDVVGSWWWKWLFPFLHASV